MRVCFLTPELPPGPSGGIGTAVAQRARALADAGHQVHVIGPGIDLATDDHGVSVRMEVVRHPPKLGWLVVRRHLRSRLRELVDHQGVQLVVAPDWLGLAAGIDPRCPVAIDCNGSATYFGDELDEPVRRTVHVAERRAVRQAAAITSVSQHVAERTTALLGAPVPITVVPNGVPIPDEATPAAGRDPGTVLHVGTVVRKKGVLEVGAAFRAVHRARPAARLRVVGPDAPDRRTGVSSTRALVAEALGPAVDATRFDGRLVGADLAAAYRSGTVLLVPSHAEAQPLVWLEGMATGLPVVAEDHPWAREVVEHGRTGLLVPPGDPEALAAAVLELLDDPDRRRELGAAAADHVRRHHDVRDLVPRLEHAWAPLVGSASPHGTRSTP
jgi:glycosyltransferase involved in cell wall biosynthesis